jgi:hypothetical protein
VQPTAGVHHHRRREPELVEQPEGRVPGRGQVGAGVRRSGDVQVRPQGEQRADVLGLTTRGRRRVALQTDREVHVGLLGQLDGVGHDLVQVGDGEPLGEVALGTEVHPHHEQQPEQRRGVGKQGLEEAARRRAPSRIVVHSRRSSRHRSAVGDRSGCRCGRSAGCLPHHRPRLPPGFGWRALKNFGERSDQRFAPPSATEVGPKAQAEATAPAPARPHPRLPLPQPSGPCGPPCSADHRSLSLDPHALRGCSDPSPPLRLEEDPSRGREEVPKAEGRPPKEPPQPAGCCCCATSAGGRTRRGTSRPRT